MIVGHQRGLCDSAGVHSTMVCMTETTTAAHPREHNHPTLREWLAGARPHTWANAFAPVVVGTGAAIHTVYGTAEGGMHLWRAFLAGVVAWSLIIGVNYANDYSDGIRGTDNTRSGPLRLVGSGIAQPLQVKLAAFGAFGVAAVAGTILSLLSSWWLILVGMVCIVAAWFYTGGKNPYGYSGWGEIAVFVFFGLVAVLGTQFTQAGRVDIAGVVGACAIGAMSASINLVNNLRDIPTDSQTGKITLAVRLGDAKTRVLYYLLVISPLVVTIILSVVVTPWALLGLVIIPLVYVASGPVRYGAVGPALIPVLGTTGRAMLVWATLTTAVLIFVS